MEAAKRSASDLSCEACSCSVKPVCGAVEGMGARGGGTASFTDLARASAGAVRVATGVCGTVPFGASAVGAAFGGSAAGATGAGLGASATAVSALAGSTLGGSAAFGGSAGLGASALAGLDGSGGGAFSVSVF